MGRPRQYKQNARFSVSFEKANYDRVTAISEAKDVPTARGIRKTVTTYLEAFGYSAISIGAQHKRESLSAITADQRRGR